MALSAVRSEMCGLWSGSQFGWSVSPLLFKGKKTLKIPQTSASLAFIRHRTGKPFVMVLIDVLR